MVSTICNIGNEQRYVTWPGNGTWSNIWADTTDELIDFADEVLGLSRVSMIDEGYATERFMVNEGRAQEAVKNGAVPIQYGGAAMYKLVKRRAESGMKVKDRR